MFARLRALFGGAPEEANEQGRGRPSPAASGGDATPTLGKRAREASLEPPWEKLGLDPETVEAYRHHVRQPEEKEKRRRLLASAREHADIYRRRRGLPPLDESRPPPTTEEDRRRMYASSAEVVAGWDRERRRRQQVEAEVQREEVARRGKWSAHSAQRRR